MRLSLKTAYGIVAEPFRTLNDLYTSGDDIAHALSMGFSRALNAYHQASRAATELSFETCVRKNDGPAHLPSYTAVSYAWGDPTPRHTILVDGLPRIIAQNLWEFLMRTRSDNETRWLWIDALSISQSNLEERRHQVGIMSRIFSGADKVLVWLGDASDRSAMGMVAQRFPSQRATPGDILKDFCERPYRQRLWVFQEFRRAQCIELVCSENQVDWKDFEALFNGSIDLYRVFTPSTARKVNTSTAARMERLRRKLVDPSIWNLLQETRHLACADRRDMVYAILSVVTEGVDGIEADYLCTIYELGLRVLLNRYGDRPPTVSYNARRDCHFFGRLLGVDPEDMYWELMLRMSKTCVETFAWSSASATLHDAQRCIDGSDGSARRSV